MTDPFDLFREIFGDDFTPGSTSKPVDQMNPTELRVYAAHAAARLGCDALATLWSGPAPVKGGVQ